MIINATNIGRKIDGIGRYSLSLSCYFLEHWDYPFQLFINKFALPHLKEIENKNKIKVMEGYISPDFGFKGHLMRVLWTNKLCLKNRKTLVFNTSQLEGSIYHKKQIITVHDLIPLIFPKLLKKQIGYFKYIFPIVLRNSVKILTGSQHTKHLIIDFYKIPEEKIHVIHYGISNIFFNQAFNYQKGNYILYVGRLSSTKNIDGLFKAFEILLDQYKFDLKLKLTGDESNLNFRINEKIKNKLEFMGNLADNNLKELYRKALLLIFPSFYEGFGLPPLEAMACGCPVVVSNVASLPEICGDAAYYIDPYNVESIAEGIYKVLTDESLRRSLTEKGLERAKLFSWEKSAREHIKVFEEVITSI